MREAEVGPPRWLGATLGLGALGATLGVGLDGIHSHFGATAYADPVVWGAAWWVPPLFAAAFCIGLLRPLLDRVTTPRPLPSRRAAAAALALFVLAYWVTVAPLGWPAAVAILLALFALSWWLADRTAAGLAVAAAAAVGGPAVEAILVSRGLFRHLHPPLALGLPHWLPFLYLCAAAGLGPLARRLVDGARSV